MLSCAATYKHIEIETDNLAIENLCKSSYYTGEKLRCPHLLLQSNRSASSVVLTMSRGKSKKKKTPEATPEPDSASTHEQKVDDSDTEFEEVEQTLQQSLSYDTLTWMKHVIKVQAENILKRKLAELNVEREELSNKKLESEVLALQRELADLKVNHEDTIKKFQQELDKRDKHIEKLEAQIDEIDQHNRQNNIRIVGLEETDGETTKEDIVRMMHLQNLNIGINDIEEVHRFGKRHKTKKPRDTLVSFKSNETKAHVYSKRKSIAQSICEDTKARLFINEDLTHHRAKLLYDARCMVKEKRLTATWSQSGNIMVIVHSGDKPAAVYTHEDLAEKVCNMETEETDHREIQADQTKDEDFKHS